MANILKVFIIHLAVLMMTLNVTNVHADSTTQTTLVMFETLGCVWCAAWHKDIGEIYSKTQEGCIAPLQTINMLEKFPDDYQELDNIRYSPTFVLMNNGKEVDRIVGYAGEESFWGLLSIAIKKIEPRTMQTVLNKTKILLIINKC